MNMEHLSFIYLDMMLYLVFSLLSTLFQGFPHVPQILVSNQHTKVLADSFFFLDSYYTISTGSYLQSQTAYVDIFLNKTISFLRRLLVQDKRIFSFTCIIYSILSETFFSLSFKYFDRIGKSPSHIFFLVFMTGIPNPDHPSVILSHGLRYQILLYFTIRKGP